MQPTMNPHIDSAQKLVGIAHQLLETAEQESRDLTPDEQRRYDQLLEKATAETTRAESYRSLSDTLAQYRVGKPGETRSGAPGGGTSRATDPAARPGKEFRATDPGAHPEGERAVLVPSRAEYRDGIATSPDADGGYTVPSPVWSDVVEQLRPQSVVLAARPSLFPMESSTLSLPKIGTGATAGFVEENGEIPLSNVAFTRVLLTAKKLAARVISSNEWLSDSDAGGGRNIVQRNLLLEIARVLDLKLFTGDGLTGEPVGLLDSSRTGIGRSSVGGVLSLDEIGEAIGRVEAANAQPSAIFMHPGAWASLRLERDSGSTTGAYMLTATPTEGIQRTLWGVPVFLSTALGTSALVADARAIAVGFRQGTTILFDPYSRSSYDQTVIRATSRWAVDVLHDEALEILTGITLPTDGESESESA